MVWKQVPFAESTTPKSDGTIVIVTSRPIDEEEIQIWSSSCSAIVVITQDGGEDIRTVQSNKDIHFITVGKLNTLAFVQIFELVQFAHCRCGGTQMGFSLSW